MVHDDFRSGGFIFTDEWNDVDCDPVKSFVCKCACSSLKSDDPVSVFYPLLGTLATFLVLSRAISAEKT